MTLVDLSKPGAKPRALITGFTNNYSYVGNRGTTFYFQTNEGAPRLKVVAIDVAQANPAARTIIAEDQATLDGVVDGRRQADRLLSGRRQDRGARP